ncbi:MAG: L-serine ammonia-lyase, iron-sulfur-dependent subunit beta [Oscillospiraceae bacterium]|nr:L-serine ammonia-lyase, iron-sulfur-dependent, subunit beta [Oscillospiraceae bacterium]MBQ6850460.1 L-serine ammonia-lyase, iron-sulfur-dependent subunit beta [Oscillospiraceae bacterium]MBR6610574.1 L-serine ammonia-lyase, iron-sulfur-dependent subunit beta [Oscillospiraceae bacterium]
MNISLLDVVGPVMIGPSSSHTAGAAKLAKTARLIYDKPFKKVRFGLGGSFASTYRGHFTDYALVAGALGMNEDDERLGQSFEIAEKEGVEFVFYPTEIPSVYENTARITFVAENGDEFFVEGASLGGGRILITNINGLVCELNATMPTVIVQQQDVKGVVSDVSTILAFNNINIGVMKVSRTSRGEKAFCVIECDDIIPENVIEELRQVNNVLSVVVVNIKGE